MKKVSKKNNKYINLIVILAVLIIPFMYSFFYLKAYWNPYGEGNIDNLPVVIVNEDKGDKGQDIIDSINDSKKLKIYDSSYDEALDGLNKGDYYALIDIPSDFTESLENVSSSDRKHPTITYSPNQKSNYLASQIINSVVNAVVKNLDNKINSEIVGSLSNKLNEVPSSLETISSGFDELSGGINQLQSGSKQLVDGSNQLKEGLGSLSSNYETFNNGINTLNNGTNQLVYGSNQFNQGLNNYVNLANAVVNSSSNMANACLAVANGSTDESVIATCKSSALLSYPIKNVVLLYESNQLPLSIELYGMFKTLDNQGLGDYTLSQAVAITGNKINSSYDTINSSITTVNNGVSELNKNSKMINSSIKELSNGSVTLYNGINTLNNGNNTLNSSVKSAKKELDENINNTKEELNNLNGLKEYSESPVNIETNAVNEITSYGVAFAPLFISIGLWVGCLMMYVVLYYDKDQRFKLLGKDSNNYVKRSLVYHALATIAGIVLGVLLHIFLDINLSNAFLYYLSIILISNMFMSIMNFLIVKFDDVGKFLALIILVLQLAASGGTFPIETVTKGFRWLNNLLPMTYSIRLLKEPIVNYESNLFANNLVIICIIFIVLIIINLINDIKKEKRM